MGSSRSQSQGADPGKLALFGAGAAPGGEKSAVGIQLGDPLVFAELGHVITAVLILHGVADVAELPRTAARLAANGPQQCAVRGVDQQAVVMGIADEEVAVAIDAQPTGPAVAIVGRGPGVAADNGRRDRRPGCGP